MRAETSSGSVFKLAPREPQDGVAAALQVGVAGAVILERGAAPVGAIAIGLDDHALVGPEEVQHVRPQPVVDVRTGEAGVGDEPEHALLELAVGVEEHGPGIGNGRRAVIRGSPGTGP
jgi:hypothetical protein